MMKTELSKGALLMLSILFLFTSCEKELNSETDSVIQDAKTWYLKSLEKTTTAFNGKYKINVVQKELWEDAKVYEVEGAPDVVAVPVDVKKSSGVDAKGDFMLFISKVNGEFVSIIAYNENENFFKGVLTKDEILSLYASAQARIKAHVKSTAESDRKTTMGVPGGDPTNPGGTCTDWYWTVYAVDDLGNPLYIITEQYLYTTCDDDNGGGGDGPNTPPDELPPPPLPPTGIPVNRDETMDIELETDSFKVVKKWWTYCDGFTFKLRSRERLAVKVNNGARTYDNITHLQFDHSGFWAGGGYTVSNQSAEVGIYSNRATSYIKYTIDYIPLAIFKSPSFSPGQETSFNVWDVYFNQQ